MKAVRAVMVRRRGGEVADKILIREGGSWERVEHYPWLYAYGVDLGEETDIDFYGYSHRAWRYERLGKARLLKTRQPRDVRTVAEILEKRGARHSFSNIRYEARLSLDMADAFHGVRVPVPLHYGFTDLEEIMMELRDKLVREKILAFDIEVASSTGGFPKPGDKVFLLSMSDGEDAWVLEGEEVCDLAREVRRTGAAFIFGFNSAGFDIPYLRSYCGLTDLDEAGLWSPPTPHIDLMLVLDAHGAAFGLPQGKRMALDDVAVYLGLATREEAEIESSVDRARIYEEYKKSPEKVIKYAKTDAMLTARLARYVYPVLGVLYALTGIAPNVIQLLPTLGSLSEYAVMEIVRRRYNKVYEVRTRQYNIRGIAGHGDVYSNKYKDMFAYPMVLDNVVEYDFNMLYPSIYTRYNLDPEGIVAGKGFKIPLLRGDQVIWVALTSSGGPVAETLKYFYYARKATKAIKKKGWEAPDQAVKILANSAYGMFSKTRGMGVHEGISAFVFFKANEIMDKLVKWLGSRGYRVVYTATDSLFVTGVRDAERLQEEINEYLGRVFGEEFSVKLEARIKRLALIKKKTYVFIDSEGNVVVKGMEKLQLPRAVKDSLEEIFEAELIEGKGYEKLLEVIRHAPEEDLFVRTSKTLRDALWDHEKARWKSLNNNGSRAVAIQWLLYNNLTSADICVNDLTDYPIIAKWLGGGKKLVIRYSGQDYVYVLDRVDYGRRCVYIKGVVVETRLPRRELERLAIEKSRVVKDYIDTIRKARSVRGLGAWMRS